MGREPRVWHARHVEWEIRRPLVMGILNVTPDSFSDGGKYFTDHAAVAHGLRLAEEGADVIDVGGESTRPGAAPVDATEEWRRIGPVVSEIARRDDVPISVDTYKPEVARKAIRAGAVIVNDIHGLRNPEMVRLVANSDAGAVIMHMQGEPATMNRQPTYADVVLEVRAFLEARMGAAERGGVSREAIVVDPGFGFGKSPSHNSELLRRLDEIASLQRPVLVGVSGKSFEGPSPGTMGPNSIKAGIETTNAALQGGAHIARVHDVLETVRFIRETEGGPDEGLRPSASRGEGRTSVP